MRFLYLLLILSLSTVHLLAKELPSVPIIKTKYYDSLNERQTEITGQSFLVKYQGRSFLLSAAHVVEGLETQISYKKNSYPIKLTSSSSFPSHYIDNDLDLAIIELSDQFFESNKLKKNSLFEFNPTAKKFNLYSKEKCPQAKSVYRLNKKDKSTRCYIVGSQFDNINPPSEMYLHASQYNSAGNTINLSNKNLNLSHIESYGHDEKMEFSRKIELIRPLNKLRIPTKIHPGYSGSPILSPTHLEGPNNSKTYQFKGIIVSYSRFYKTSWAIDSGHILNIFSAYFSNNRLPNFRASKTNWYYDSRLKTFYRKGEINNIEVREIDNTKEQSGHDTGASGHDTGTGGHDTGTGGDKSDPSSKIKPGLIYEDQRTIGFKLNFNESSDLHDNYYYAEWDLVYFIRKNIDQIQSITPIDTDSSLIELIKNRSRSQRSEIKFGCQSSIVQLPLYCVKAQLSGDQIEFKHLLYLLPNHCLLYTSPSPRDRG